MLQYQIHNKHKHILGLFNIIILFTIFNTLFILLYLAYNNIYIYQKIFINEQQLHDKQLEIDEMLINSAIIFQNGSFISNSKKFALINFIPDDLTYLCANGINIYELQINDISYGFLAKRIIKTINHKHLQQQKLYYENLILQKGFKANNLTLIDLYHHDQIDEIFFIEEMRKLWSYNIKLNKFILQYCINVPIINYMVTNPILNNHLDKSCKYNIYIHHRDDQQDTIKLVYFSNENNTSAENNASAVHRIANYKSIELLTSHFTLNKIFIRANYIITVAIQNQNNHPVINAYKLDYNNHYYQLPTDNTEIDIKYNKVAVMQIQKIDLKIDTNLPLQPTDANLPLQPTEKYSYHKYLNSHWSDIELLWNEKHNYHQMNIWLNHTSSSYYFKLDQDNFLLSYKEI